jgi:hypothetical protein
MFGGKGYFNPGISRFRLRAGPRGSAFLASFAPGGDFVNAYGIQPISAYGIQPVTAAASSHIFMAASRDGSLYVAAMNREATLEMYPTPHRVYDLRPQRADDDVMLLKLV